jgi:hypothetical protein
MVRGVILFSILLLIGASTFAQDMRFTGVVNEPDEGRPLENVVVMAIRLSDAQLLGFTRTDRYGRFELLNIPMDTMELVFTHPKYDDKNYYIIGSEENLTIDIPNVVMPEQATEMQEVVVFANKEPIYFRGDTLVYVADSFARKENAVVEDLLKNLPGIDVDKDGKISSGGREVTKVLVDGDEFFGSDPTIATRNLEADGIKTIEIYETEDETAGGNSEEKIQVMDLRLKDDAKQGYFGKIAGAGGGNPELFAGDDGGRAFYQGEALANYFSDKTKISAFGLGSNTPNTGFSYQDASRFGLTNEMSGGWRGRFIGGNQRQQGIPEAYKAGFYYSDKIGDKSKIGLNYTFNRAGLLVEEDISSQFFLQDTSYSRNEQKMNNTLQNSHTVNFNFETQLDSLTKFELISNATYRDEFDESENETDFLSAAGILTNRTSVRNESTGEGLEANINAILTRKFKKRNRKLLAEYQFGYSENERENIMDSRIQLGPQPSSNDILFNQQRDILNKTNGHRVLVDYTEPLGRKVKLNFQYRVDYFTGNQSNITRDFINGTLSDEIVPGFSNDFDNTRLENRLGTSVIHTGRKQTVQVGSRFRQVIIDNLDNFTGNVISQDVRDILPFVEYSYKFSNAHRLRVNYTTSSQQPSLNQLQPVNDNRNPNNFIIGNPDLVPNYVHNFNAFYNKWNALEQSYIWASAFMTVRNNDFSNSIEYLPNGTMISSAINVNGNVFGGVYAGGGIPLFKKFLRLDPNVNVTYNRFNSEVVNNFGQTQITEMNITENISYTGGLNLSVRNDTIEVSIGMDFTYSDPSSSLSMGANQPFTTQTYKAEVFFELPWRMFIESDVRYIVNTQRAEGFNVTPLIWNAKLSRRFTQTGNLVFSLEAYDILDQNIGIDRQILNNVIIDNRTQVIARYFMIGATWRFNNKKAKEDEGRNRWF